MSVFHTCHRAICSPNRNAACLIRGPRPTLFSPRSGVSIKDPFPSNQSWFLVLSAHWSARSYSSLLRRLVLSVTRRSSSAVHMWGRTGDRVKERRQEERIFLLGRFTRLTKEFWPFLYFSSKAPLLPQSTLLWQVSNLITFLRPDWGSLMTCWHFSSPCNSLAFAERL